ncbi:MAG: beta-N-acetylhexosaminidase [Bacteroidales bacterium]|nr:beta-N-acetylhexosaminidase [Bacteroidales bacterium]
MRKLIIALAASFLCLNAAAGVKVVPQPLEVKESRWSAKLPSEITIDARKHTELAQTYIDLSSAILGNAGITLSKGGCCAKVKFCISKRVKGQDAYVLKVRGSKVRIKAASEDGLWAGLQTLTQLLVQGLDKNVTIKDKARFRYRGAMLDCGRHFWEVEDVKKFIDMMAVHKLNVFHWHLTEDQGWRIEIKKYPLLTEVGSIRNGGYMTNYEVGAKVDTYVDEPYGGFYTQEDIKEIVAYATAHHILVIPEIEIPGHSVAALASYPWLGCTGGPYEVRKEWGISQDVLCIGKETTLQFCLDVLEEVCELFPGPYVHIGGDEAPRTRWAECPHCQALKEKEGLKTEAELQSWITSKVEDFLAERGKSIIGWDEILEGGVRQSAVVMDWLGKEGGQKAAAAGNDVIMVNKHYCYFDCYQTEDRSQELCAHRRNIPLSKVWEFDPVSGMDEAAQAHVLGIQCNTWTEHLSDFDRVYFMNLPRMSALCEIAWSTTERCPYQEFLQRMEGTMIPLYKAAGWNFAEFYKADFE